MKKLLTIAIGMVLLAPGCMAESNKEGKNNSKAVSSETVSNEIKSLTNETFKQKIFNYEANKEWKYEGKLPAIIDFYADWCGPCRILSPRVEAIAKEYHGKIVVYKVNTDAETILAQNLGIQNLPTLLFIPMKGKPRATMGALPKETLVKAVNDILLNKK
jgi:thioredoxin